MRALASALLAVLVGLAPAPAVARTKGQRAEALKRQAFRHVAEADYALGVEKLEAAYALVPHPTLLFNIAVVYDQWPGHCEEALAAFDRFFEACPDCRTRPTGEKRYARVKARCQVRVDVRSDPTGAELRVDGTPAGRTPTQTTLLPGEHTLELSKPGYATERRVLTLRAGRDQALDVALRATAPRAPKAALTAEAPPGRGPDPWMVASFSTAGAGAVLGGIFSALTVDTLNREQDARRSGSPDVPELQDEARARYAVAVAGWSVAAVGLVGGLTLLLTQDDDGPEALELGPTRVGLSARF